MIDRRNIYRKSINEKIQEENMLNKKKTLKGKTTVNNSKRENKGGE